MSEEIYRAHERILPEFLAGGGGMGDLIRQFNWAGSPVGPVETWPQNLRTCIRIMLASRQPIWIGWGKELIKFYNDPYKSIVGGKHPWALGQPARQVWKDIWREIEPMLKVVMEKDEGTYVESQLLIMERNGYPEETYYTFSYTPIPGDDGKPAGMICANTDDTDRIISERQLRTLTDLGKNLTETTSDVDVISKTIRTLEENPQDFPFALFYLAEHNKLVLADHTQLGIYYDNIPKEIDLSGDNEITKLVNAANKKKEIQVLEELRSKLGDMPKGAWEISPNAAIIIPVLQSAAASSAYGYLAVGLNPYRLLNEDYKTFFSLVSDQVAKSFVKNHALKEERKRAEALAEIDRAKTTFFSNISHEFRTPLTLLLGPVSDALADEGTTGENKLRMEVAYRNALRMQKLVNTLLDFSKIEAGRLEGRFSKVDLCELTTDLASTFRSAIEKAGMELKIDCGTIDEDVYVDVDMWEKIVLNLLSNAFKYSREGTIEIRLRQKFNKILFSVTDRGIGIPADQLEKIFDRFHRVENRDSRSEEGTGIGLSLVRELVRLHGGNILVKSVRGSGSTFTVSLPTGKDHIDGNKIYRDQAKAFRTNNSIAFVEESLRWIPEDGISNGKNETAGEENHEKNKPGKPTVLLADDNTDMRSYVKRLLSSQFHVITASNGEEAYGHTIKYKPDLVLTDIMMPVLNGFELLKKIRQNNQVKNIPVIFVSARAGEESKIEGLDAGADDYLVKPFSARELVARVEGNIRIANSRLAAEENLKNIIMQAPVAMSIFRGETLVLEIANQSALDMWGKSFDNVINKTPAQAFPEAAAEFAPIIRQVYDTGIPFFANERPVPVLKNGQVENAFLNFVLQPLKNEEGKIVGVVTAASDVTEQVIALKKLEKNRRELNELANAVPQLVWIAEPSGRVIYYNDRVSEFSGAKKLEDGSWNWEGLVHPDDAAATAAAWETAVKTGNIYQAEHRIQKKDGSFRWYLSRGYPHHDEHGNISKWFGTATDIHVAKEYAHILEEQVQQRTFELQELNKILQQSNDDLQQFAHVASHDLKEPLRKIKTYSGRLADDDQTILSERSATFLHKMNSATDRMFSMIEGVLSYSTVNAGEEPYELIDLNETVREIKTDLELLIQDKNAIITSEQLPFIEGVPVLIYQLFYNLLNNALKFSSPGIQPVINISSQVVESGNRNFAEIAITDNGIGFDKSQAEKIFDPFARLNSKDKYEGTGLGLSLCKKIVQRHGGTISAQSIKNSGAKFTIRLLTQQKTNA